MANNIIAFNDSTDIAAFEDLDTGLNQVLADTQLPGFEKLLRMSPEGDIVYGMDNTMLGDDRLAMNPGSIEHGWVAWPSASATERKILGEVMVRASEPKPLRQDLIKKFPAIDPALWKDQITFQVLLLEGPGRGEQLLYKVSSTSGVREALALVRQVVAQRRVAASAGHKKFIPIVRVGTEKFDTKYRTQTKPKWHIQDYVEPGTDLGALFAAHEKKPAVAAPTDGVAPRARRVPA